MKVKTFLGKSLPEAVALAKQQYGDDIIILESKEVTGNNGRSGKKLTQVTVSVNENEKQKEFEPWDPPVISRKRKTSKPVVEAGAKKNDFNSMITNILAKKPDELNQEKKILEEIALLRQEVNQLNRKSKNSSVADFPDVFITAYDELKEKGIDENLVYTFIKRVYQLLEDKQNISLNDVYNGVKSEMRRVLRAYDFSNKSKKQKVILLLGSTGVGKTTTAMKLAAHPDIYGKKDVAIISTDLYGSSEALKAFSKMSGASIYEVKTSDELENILIKFKNKEVIIVDTPGQSPFAPNHLNKLEEYLKIVNPTDIFLVLSMSADTKDLFLSCAVYLLLKPSGVVFTKFDETTQPGKLFSIVDELDLPVVCMCEGKRVFIDVALGNVEFMFDKIFEKTGVGR